MLLSLISCLPRTASAQMSGNYTIDPNGTGATNFISFSDAVSALHAGGVSGNVVFSVASGTYHEGVTINAVSGTGPTAVVTFQGSTGNPADCMIDKQDPTSSGSGAINFRGSTFITFRGMHINNSMSGILFSSTSAIQIKDNASNLSFENCIFSVDSVSANAAGYGGNPRFVVLVASSQTFSGIPSLTPGSQLSFKRCAFRGGAVGIAMTGEDEYATAETLIVDSCEFAQQASAFMELKFTRDVQVKNCVFDNMRMPTTAMATPLNGNGIRFINTWDFELSGNYINSWRVPLYVEFPSAAGGTQFNTSLVTNNYMTAEQSALGIFYRTSNIKFYHNTFKTYNADVAGVQFTTSADNMAFVNNIVQAGSGSTSYAFQAPSGFSWDMDNNVYYGASGAFMFGSSVYPNLSGWQSTWPLYNANSIVDTLEMEYRSPVIVAGETPVYGSSNPGITTDIYGTGRCDPPSVGAYEYRQTFAADSINPSSLTFNTSATAATDTIWISIRNYIATQPIGGIGLTLLGAGATEFTVINTPVSVAALDSAQVGIVFGAVASSQPAQYDAELVIHTVCPYAVNDTIVLTGMHAGGPTAVPKNTHATVPKVVPNPVGNTLLISGITSDHRVVLYDLTGKVLTAVAYNNGIDVSALKPGVYFLKIADQQSPGSLRFVKL